MLSIGKLAPGRADYYLDTVARGAEEYYGSGERPGHWLGRGAERLGLADEVDGMYLRWVLKGRGPKGRMLIAKPHPNPTGCPPLTARSTSPSP